MRNVRDPGRSSDSFGARRWAGMGRQLPTADVGYLVSQLGGPLSEGEIVRPTGACRPKGVGHTFLVERPVHSGSGRSRMNEVVSGQRRRAPLFFEGAQGQGMPVEAATHGHGHEGD